MNYTIRPGDTLWSIANRFGVSLQALMQANGITNPASIYVGQTIFIPTTGGAFPPGPGPGPGPGPVPGIGINQRLERLEREQNQLQRQVNQLNRRIDQLEARVRRLER